MIYKVLQIMRDVRVAMDQNGISDQLLSTGDIDTLTIDEIIRSKIEEGARRAVEIAPLHFLEHGHSFGDAVYWGERESGWVLLPDDFMRVISFRMSDWERTVHNAITAEDPEYQLQSSRHKGIRGNFQKPVCAIINRPEGKALEFYSCRTDDAYVAKATYLPYPRIDQFNGIDLSERCYQAVVYFISALTTLALGETEKASSFIEMAKSILR